MAGTASAELQRSTEATAKWRTARPKGAAHQLRIMVFLGIAAFWLSEKNFGTDEKLAYQCREAKGTADILQFVHLTNFLDEIF